MPVTTLHSVGVGLKKPLLPAHAPTSLRVEKEAREKARTRPALVRYFIPLPFLRKQGQRVGRTAALMHYGVGVRLGLGVAISDGMSRV